MGKLLFNDKISDCITLCLKSRVLVLEGSARSGKTASLTSEGIYFSVINSREKYHIIACRDLDAIRNNILNADVVGLLQVHRNCRIKKDKIGGYFIRVKGVDGQDKEVMLINYSNESSWKKILGMTLGVVYIDEVNIANETFVEECFARQLSADRPVTIFTTNGDDPNHWIYLKYINYCKMIGRVPASIQKEMLEFQAKHQTHEGWYYTHWVMQDNPAMTPEKIERAYAIYPVGSYYYTTKILGERGIQGDLLFMDYMSDALVVDVNAKDEYDQPLYKFASYSFGFDTGGGRAFNSITLIGFERHFKRAVILNRKVFIQTGMKAKKPIVFQFVRDCMKMFNFDASQVDGMLVDCADTNGIADLKDELYDEFKINAVGSYKATIRERIEMMSIGFSTGRILFSTLCRDTYEAYYHAQKDDKPFTRLDTNETNAKGDNDQMDSTEYGLTRHMKELMRSGGNY